MKTYPKKAKKSHKLDRKDLNKAEALVKDRMEWLRSEVARLQKENRDQRSVIESLKMKLKETEIARSITSSKRYATRATMRKIRALLDKDYQLNA